ncbi:type IX secretion/gliding motility protein PorT/SprT [Faecalibacter macacae]|uniref:PorT family protein n=1 Tax=Faecalibacter macacae TaxID=1859289 RepID=A0A3L9MNS9_9FLAO|nr:porin family protein [Faecalibacter macacae]RLZ12309.1 PorT family protein [Faecalibacter macacae]
MRKNLLTAIALSTTTLVCAQFRPNSEREWNRVEQDEKKFSFGYFLGTNVMSYKVSPKAQNNHLQNGTTEDDGVNSNGLVYLDQESKPGFSVGLIGKLKMNDYIAVKTEPTIHFTQRTLIFNNIEVLSNQDPDVHKREVKSTYLEIPLLLNFSGDRWFNTKPYIQGGVAYVNNLQSNEDKEDDNELGVFRTNTHNFSWQAEMGIEIYFKRFKLTPSVKGLFFFNNELVPDKETTIGYSNTLNSLQTRAVVFSLKFE